MEKQNGVLKRRNEEKAMLEKRIKDSETKQANVKDHRYFVYSLQSFSGVINSGCFLVIRRGLPLPVFGMRLAVQKFVCLLLIHLSLPGLLLSRRIDLLAVSAIGKALCHLHLLSAKVLEARLRTTPIPVCGYFFFTPLFFSFRTTLSAPEFAPEKNKLKTSLFSEIDKASKKLSVCFMLTAPCC
jgi:hypothetical protein